MWQGRRNIEATVWGQRLAVWAWEAAAAEAGSSQVASPRAGAYQVAARAACRALLRQ